jgi:hypothetical protein
VADVVQPRRVPEMLRRVLSAVLIPLTAGCTSIGPVANPREFIPISRPREIWLTQNDGTVLLMYTPRLMGDSILGVVRGEGERRIARNDIQQVVAALPSPDKTRLAIIFGGILGVGALGVVWRIASTHPEPPSACDRPENEC